jgi:hypothetical protein
MPLAAALLGVLCASSGARTEDEPSFRERVAPILAERCGECHGPDVPRAKAGLRFSSREALLAGGISGPAVVPGDPDASLLVQAIRYGDESLQMPPDGPLPAGEVEALVEWVRRGAPWESEPVSPEAARLFEDEIRPLLAERCFRCHGPELGQVEGGFRMAGRAGFLAGGNHGPALVPGDPSASRLITAVHYQDRYLRMPPDGKLGDQDIARLEQWIALGAPWPNYDGPALERGQQGLDVEAGRSWWAFRPVTRPAVPALQDESAAAGPIDAFVLAPLEAQRLAPNPIADDRTLIRRLYLDVLGVPPTYEEVERYASDVRPERWEELVDSVLARPEYGERLARRWFDLVRYAQTNGYERDTEKPLAWRYRDWVIRAFAEDLPYDRFLMLQLAGDELPDSGDDSLVATGFYRVGPWDDEPDDAQQAEFDELDDVVRAISEGMLGVTLGCARCHDHKFDPFPQEDYYSLLAFLRGVRRFETPEHSLDSAVLRPLDPTAADLERWRRDQRAALQEVEAQVASIEAGVKRAYVEAHLDEQPAHVIDAYRTPEGRRSRAQVASVRSMLAKLPPFERLAAEMSLAERREYLLLQQRKGVLETSYPGDLDWYLAVSESGPEPVPTYLLERGRASTPGAVVPPRFVRVLCPSDGEAVPEAPTPSGESSGLRTELAEWIASPQNPLTARVIANRIWAALFGSGIVPTPNDFGRAGLPPTHPDLLDWLASALVDADWSLKALHREILLSAAYRRTSDTDNQLALDLDPANGWLWRQNLRRLEAEAVRDSLLSAAGALVSGAPEQPEAQRGFFAPLSREALGGMSRPGCGWGRSPASEQARRTVYGFAKRGIQVPLLEAFDLSNPNLPVGARPTTTTAAQALILLNNDFVNEQAAALARRVRDEAGDGLDLQVERAFQRVLARDPDAEEARICADYLLRQAELFAALPRPLVVRPAVPRRIDQGYLEQLSGADVLYGPRAGWRYLLGEWGNQYNGTVEMDAARGPALYLPDARHADATLTARVLTRPGCVQFGLVLRAGEAADRLTGLEVRLEPEADLLAVVAHLPGESLRLAETPVELVADRRAAVGIALERGIVSVALDGEPVLMVDVAKLQLEAEGGFGLRVLGEAAELDQAALRTSDGSILPISPDPPDEPSQRALEALCLALLNSNEFVYVD